MQLSEEFKKIKYDLTEEQTLCFKQLADEFVEVCRQAKNEIYDGVGYLKWKILNNFYTKNSLYGTGFFQEAYEIYWEKTENELGELKKCIFHYFKGYDRFKLWKADQDLRDKLILGFYESHKEIESNFKFVKIWVNDFFYQNDYNCENIKERQEESTKERARKIAKLLRSSDKIKEKNNKPVKEPVFVEYITKELKFETWIEKKLGKQGEYDYLCGDVDIVYNKDNEEKILDGLGKRRISTSNLHESYLCDRYEIHLNSRKRPSLDYYDSINPFIGYRLSAAVT